MAYLLAQDTVNGAEGQVFITVKGKNTEIAGMRNITTQVELQDTDMRVIGTRVIQTKTNGAKLSGTGNIYYGSNIFTDMVLQYINTGVMPEFSIQIVNNDPSTTIGTQNIIYYNCRLTGSLPLSILNDEEAMLNHDFSFSVGRVARMKSFKAPKTLGN